MTDTKLTFEPAPHLGHSHDPRVYEGRAGHVGKQAPYLLKPHGDSTGHYSWSVLLYQDKPPLGQAKVIAEGLSFLGAKRAANAHYRAEQ